MFVCAPAHAHTYILDSEVSSFIISGLISKVPVRGGKLEELLERAMKLIAISVLVLCILTITSART